MACRKAKYDLGLLDPSSVVIIIMKRGRKYTLSKYVLRMYFACYYAVKSRVFQKMSAPLNELKIVHKVDPEVWEGSQTTNF